MVLLQGAGKMPDGAGKTPEGAGKTLPRMQARAKEMDRSFARPHISYPVDRVDKDQSLRSMREVDEASCMTTR